MSAHLTPPSGANCNVRKNHAMVNKRCKVVSCGAENTEAKIVWSINWTVPHDLKACQIKCVSCGAYHWLDQATEDEKMKARKSFSQCCQKNKVTLPAFQESARPYPKYLTKLLTGSSEGKSPTQPEQSLSKRADLLNYIDSKNFQKLKRMYNNSISFTSLGPNINKSVRGPKGVNIFQMLGALTSLVSCIEPANQQDPGFSQIYVVGTGGTDEAKHRI